MFFDSDVVIILSAILTLIAAIVLAIFFGPSRKRDSLSGFGGWLNDLFNFRSLFIEKILKFLYILATCSCIVFGLVNAVAVLIEGEDPIMILEALALVVVGPIAVRFAFEFLMMAILLVTNVIEINRKLRWPEGEGPEKRHTPAQAPVPPAPEPVYGYCTQCGTKFDLNQGNCPNCGRR